MKTILIATDFSESATHAVSYGYYLAQQIKANIILCNAITVPAEMPKSRLVVWPMDTYDSLLNTSISEITQLKGILELIDPSNDFHPVISCVNEEGTLSEVVQNVSNNQDVDLVIMGTHKRLGISCFMLGDHTRSMIDNVKGLILFIPIVAKIQSISKIAYAADFKHPKEGLASFNIILSLARVLDAKIILTHIYNEKHNSPDFHNWAKQSLINLQKSSDYDAITYKFLPHEEVEQGLSVFCEQEDVDLLAMVHRPYNLIGSIISGSKTKKVAKSISIPLLVLPVNY